jgi:hypothetical protein
LAAPSGVNAFPLIVLVLVGDFAPRMPGWKRDEWRKQRRRFRSCRKADEDDDENWDMTLNTYKPWTGLCFFGHCGPQIGTPKL